MIEDAVQRQFELIITKEVSRFSRNILDAISYTRRLKEMGVGVIFLNDGISTLETDAELRLGIMASVAQEESRKTSERVRWGQMRKMERGIVFGRSLLGYDVKGGTLSIEPEGAEIVRIIYDMYLHNRVGVRAIAQALSASKTATKSGGFNWSGATVLKILKNEKYCGDLIQKKTVTVDYLTHKKKANRNGDRIIIPGHHEPIISRADWEAVQHELARRSPKKDNTEAGGNRYALSGRISCAGCKTVYLCRTRTGKDGKCYRAWTCSQCRCTLRQRQLREEDLVLCVRTIMASMDIDRLLNSLRSVIMDIICNQERSATAQKKNIIHIENKKINLIDAFVSGDVSREEYCSVKAQYDGELAKCCAALDRIKEADTGGRTAEMLQIMSLMASGDDPDSDFYLALVNKINVIGADDIEILLKGQAGKWTVIFWNDKK